MDSEASPLPGVAVTADKTLINRVGSCYDILVQSWLAVHGRALREAVTEQRLWLRALETMPSDGTVDGRWLAVQRRMASDYRAACLEVHLQHCQPKPVRRRTCC